MQHQVEMLVTEVHEYSMSPVVAMGGPGPPGIHQLLGPGAGPEHEQPLVCIHMQKVDRSPVEPDLPEEGRMMMKGLQMAGMPIPSKMLHVVASANIVISLEEYDRMGRPRAHEKIRVTFEYERP